MSGDVLIWCQHVLGTGHLRRAASLAMALREADLAVTLVSGGPPVPWLNDLGPDTHQLPWCKARDAAFSALVDAEGDEVGAPFWARRRNALRSILDDVRPRALVSEMFPFGRRAFTAEVLGMIEHARHLRPDLLTVCSVRDILVSGKKPGREEAMRDLAQAHYDHVLVHSDPRLLPFETTFPFAQALEDRLHYTGFVIDGADQRPAARADAPAEVLVSAGGGEVGALLLRTAIAARPLTLLADRPWRLIGGANLPDETFDALRVGLPAGIALDRHRSDFLALLAGCLLSVSQCGYNTAIEVMRAGCPAVFVPFGSGDESEQTTRARALAEHGLASWLSEDALEARTLADAIDRAWTSPRPSVDLDLNGAERSAALIEAWLEVRR